MVSAAFSDLEKQDETEAVLGDEDEDAMDGLGGRTEALADERGAGARFWAEDD